MDNKSKKIKSFIEEYESFIKEWYKNNNKYLLDKDEFIATLYKKIFEKNILDQYDIKHYSGASFETWLKKVLLNHYIDLVDKEFSKKNLPNRISIEEELEIETGSIKRQYTSISRIENDNDQDPKIDVQKISKLLKNIKNVRYRIIVKLKLYMTGLFNFTEEENEYMAEMIGVKKEKVQEFIENNKKTDGGIKNSIISILTGMAEGSISTTFDRIVNKNIKEPYKNWEIGIE